MLHGACKTAKKTSPLEGGRNKETTMLNLNDNCMGTIGTHSDQQSRKAPAIASQAERCTSTKLTLLEIGELMKLRKTLRFLPADVEFKIQKLKSHQKRRRGRREGRKQRRRKMTVKYKLMRQGYHANLIHDRDRHVKTRQVNLIRGLANERSIKNRDVWIKQILVEENIDLCILTETWFNSNDMPWLDCSDLNNNGYRMDYSFRNNGKQGGVLAIIYKD